MTETDNRMTITLEVAPELEHQIKEAAAQVGLSEEKTETEEDIRASEESWDQLLAQPEAKRVLREMAREARDDYQAGRTTGITIMEDGRLAPA